MKGAEWMAKRRFEMTMEHVSLLRRMYVGWNSAEYGAPEVDPKRPYGNSDVLDDIAKILGIEGFVDANNERHFSAKEVALMERLHTETMTALQVVLATGSFAPGVYEADPYKINWQWVKEVGA